MNAVTETKARDRFEEDPQVQRELAEHALKSAILFAREKLGEEKVRQICKEAAHVH